MSLLQRSSLGATPDAVKEAFFLGKHISCDERARIAAWIADQHYYTLLSLMDLDLPAARRELRYAAPACERALKPARRDGGIAARRRTLLERVPGAG